MVYIQLHSYYQCLQVNSTDPYRVLRVVPSEHTRSRTTRAYTATMAVCKHKFASIVTLCVLYAAAHPCSAANGIAEAHVAVPEPAVPDATPVVPASNSGAVVATSNSNADAVVATGSRKNNNMVTVQMYWQNGVWFSGWFRSLGRAAQVRLGHWDRQCSVDMA